MTVSPHAQQAPAVLSLLQQHLCLFDRADVRDQVARYLAIVPEMPTEPDAPIAGP
jgi:hypothetical protein